MTNDTTNDAANNTTKDTAGNTTTGNATGHATTYNTTTGNADKSNTTQETAQGGARDSTVVAVSGGFDPVHIGHVRMFIEAKRLGSHLVVIVNNDNWIALKKGYPFMPEKERKEIIEAFEVVDEVMLTRHTSGTKDMSVCEELAILKPDIFANGGDRKAENIPEYELCDRLGIKMVFGIGHGGKVQSSSDMVKLAKEHDAMKPDSAEAAETVMTNA